MNIGRPKGIKNKTHHKWTDEEKRYLASIVKGSTYKEITEKMNKRFECQFTKSQIRGALSRYNLTSGSDGSFKKGHVPWNKGKRVFIGGVETRFKKGQRPSSYREVGSERVNRDGYIEIKTEPNKWELKHRYIYRQYYGEFPKECNIIFADKNTRNFNINNLVLVTKRELLIMNNNKLMYEDEELTKVGVNIAKVLARVSDIKK